MIAKEWRDAGWKFLIAAAVVALLSLEITPYGELERAAAGAPTMDPDGAPIPEPQRFFTDPVKLAVNELAGFLWAGGLVVLIPLAGVFGATLVSGEMGGGTLYLLLAKPIGRTRLLLTKYGVCAAILLAAAFLGGVLLVGVAAVRGYPLGNFSLPGIFLSTLLMWLGSLFVLGTALLMSVIFRSVIASLGATTAALILVFSFPDPPLNVLSFFGVYSGFGSETISKLRPISYWFDEPLFKGESLALTNFLFWLTAAGVSLLVALWLFRRKAY